MKKLYFYTKTKKELKNKFKNKNDILIKTLKISFLSLAIGLTTNQFAFAQIVYPGQTPSSNNSLSNVFQPPTPAQTFSVYSPNTSNNSNNAYNNNNSYVTGSGATANGYTSNLGASYGGYANQPFSLNATGLNRPSSQSITSLQAAEINSTNNTNNQNNANNNTYNNNSNQQTINTPDSGIGTNAILSNQQQLKDLVQSQTDPKNSPFTPQEQALLQKNNRTNNSKSTDNDSDKSNLQQTPTVENQASIAPGTRYSGFAKAVNGSTLIVDNQRVQLSGLIVPDLNEICFNGKANYWCGRSSRDYLDQLVSRGPIVCTVTDSTQDTTTASCRLGRDDISSAMVEAGQAKSDDPSMLAQMSNALNDHRGLWLLGGKLPRFTANNTNH